MSQRWNNELLSSRSVAVPAKTAAASGGALDSWFASAFTVASLGR
jgi:hypothetical protein